MNVGFIKRSRRQYLIDILLCCIVLGALCYVMYYCMAPRYAWYDCKDIMNMEDDDNGTTIDLFDGIYEYSAVKITFEEVIPEGEKINVDHWSLTELPRKDTEQGVVDAGGSVTIEGEFDHDRMLHADRNGISGLSIRYRLFPAGIVGIISVICISIALYIIMGIATVRNYILQVVYCTRQKVTAIPDEKWTGVYVATFFMMQTLILGLLIVSDNIRFMTNDDTTMAAIAGGGYGGIPSQYIVNIHTLIGYVLKCLYSIFPTVNWLTMLYLLMYAVSFLLLDILLVRLYIKNNKPLTIPFIVLGLSFFLFHMVFTFTGVAYAMLSAGMVCAFSAKDSYRLYAVSLIYILVGAMIRSDVINTSIVIIVIYGTLCFITVREKNKITKLGAMVILLIIVEALSYGSNAYLLDRNPIEAGFYEWGEKRSSALDCTQVPYSEELRGKGMSEASYEACYNGFYYVRDAVSEEKMQLLEEANTRRYNLDIAGYFIRHFRAYTDGTFTAAIWQFLFGALVICGIVHGDENSRWRLFSLYIAIIGADMIYYILNRQLPHVVIPTYIMGMLAAVRIYAAGIKRERITKTTVWIVVAFIVWLSCAAGNGNLLLGDTEKAVLHDIRYYI